MVNQNQSQSSLYYYGARYYDLKSAVFRGVDPSLAAPNLLGSLCSSGQAPNPGEAYPYVSMRTEQEINKYFLTTLSLTAGIDLSCFYKVTRRTQKGTETPPPGGGGREGAVGEYSGPISATHSGQISATIPVESAPPQTWGVGA